MKKTYQIIFPLFIILILVACDPTTRKSPEEKEISTEQVAGPKEVMQGPISLVIHGGAGTIKRENMTEEKDAEYRAKLAEALEAGYAKLEDGAPAMEAVIAAIQIMEESPLFNAGKGAVFTNEGKNELDAAVMDGKTRNAGAVAGVSTIKSPIEAALSVMKDSPHVMMAGKGAEKFAAEQGLEIVDPEYFFTQSRYDALQRVKAREEEKGRSAALLDFPDSKFGTVGCVALDKDGNIAAGTSTGGMTNKRYGRIGDAPIIAAGTYADNLTCGVSATGHGEYFIRSVVAYDIAAKMKYAGMSLEAAANKVVYDELVEFGGGGGIIALDRAGNISMPFNTSGMYRGYMNEKGTPKVYIYEDEK
ncbi:isoaspartyl peptidase/L-asparaginase family protein [Marivirga arenosa]|uniref:Isoaspartyl peptidase n=1 Tax=Marivirga arenosa TaxID=3059076 RepID=A0AA51ZVD3_9BACT|nr:isoaspartyl peptidase/L-asparaginase [Marivirga sp. BKB1-2]WNB17430.1 isoaspartyl peptidase/L-asparaginase [Marivirga sp. BKB1-2]